MGQAAVSVAFVIAEFPAHPPEQRTLSFYNANITYKPRKVFVISRPQRNAICISLDFAIKAGSDSPIDMATTIV